MQEPLSFLTGSDSEEIYSVTELNRAVKRLLGERFPSIFVEGEISNLARPSSGHIYFTLKDEQSQVRCAMFRSKHYDMDFIPENGDQVLVKARVSLYEPRGDYQLIVEKMEEAGTGALKRAFEALKNKLAAEGLFDPHKKQQIPSLPKKIGIITSPSGAAIRDILTVLRRRFPSIPAILYPVSVQGEHAAPEIVSAIHLANRQNECDILILARGGGSLEDLWAFNEESVARAIFKCRIPLVTGIGHEIDFTIADFVADYRAPTPSASAEAVTPDKKEWLEQFMQIEGRLSRSVQRALKQTAVKINGLLKRLDNQRLDKRLDDRSQRLDELEIRIARAIHSYLRHSSAQLGEVSSRVRQHSPLHVVNRLVSRNDFLNQRLKKAISHRLARQNLNLENLIRSLDNVSPLATLNRGYAIVLRDQDRSIVHSYKQVNEGELLHAKLAEGSLKCSVEELHNE